MTDIIRKLIKTTYETFKWPPQIVDSSSSFQVNKTPTKAFTPPAETKMGTRPGRAVTREFIGGGVYSLISVLPN